LARQFLTPVGLPTGAAVPTTGAVGQLFYNTTDSLVYQYNGSAWVSVGSGSGTVTSIATTSPITGGTITGTGTIGINASSANTANYVVQRDASGNFSAGTITAKLSGSLVSSSVGAVYYQSGVDTTAFLAAPSTTSSVLTYNTGTSAPEWTTPPAAMAKLMGYTSTATAAGTTTLTAASTYYQQFTGSTTQTVVLPVTSTLLLGWTYHVVNNSTGLVTVNSSGGNQVIIVPANTTAMVTCIDTTVTTAAGWESGITDFSTYTGSGDVVLSTSPTLAGTPLAPTALAGTNSLQIATTAFVTAAVAAGGGGTREYTYLVGVFK